MKIYAVTFRLKGELQPVVFITATNENQAIKAVYRYMESSGYTCLNEVYTVEEVGDA